MWMVVRGTMWMVAHKWIVAQCGYSSENILCSVDPSQSGRFKPKSMFVQCLIYCSRWPLLLAT